MRIAMVCHEKTYEALIKVVQEAGGEVSPPLTKWDQAIDWVESGAQLLVIDMSIPFADTISSLPLPKVVYKGSIRDFRSDFEHCLKDLQEELSRAEKEHVKSEPTVDEDEEMFTINENEIQPVKELSRVSREKPALIQNKGKLENRKKEGMDFFGKMSKVKGVKDWFPKELRREKRSNSWMLIPNRLVIYAPKASTHSVMLSWTIAQSAGTNGALAEITYPYSELAAFLQSIPPVTLMPPEEKVKQNPVWEMEGVPIISSPVVYPVRQKWNSEVVKEWLKIIEDYFRGRMIVLHLGRQMPIPVLKEVMSWSSANIWMVQDTEVDLGMADVQIETLVKQGVLLEDSVLLVEDIHGKKLPWEVLDIPVLTKMNIGEIERTVHQIGAWLEAKSGPSLVRKEV